MSGLLPLLKLLIDSGAGSPKAPTEVKEEKKTFEEIFGEPEKKVGDYCESSFGLPMGTVCVNNRVQPRLPP